MAPGKYFEKIRMLQLSSTMGASSLAQSVMAKYLSSTEHEKHLKNLRLNCSIQVNQTISRVLDYFPDGTRVSTPQGGFVLWVEMPKNIDSVELYRMALLQKISISPGILFSATNKYKNCCRLSCSNTWDDKTDKALKTLGNLAKKLYL
jgi:DNA-binding transcriptional MocR family regulator